MRIVLMTNNYKPFIGGVPISVEHLAKGEDAFHYREEAVAQKAITLYNKVAEEIKLHQTIDRKERALQWKENIMY